MFLKINDNHLKKKKVNDCEAFSSLANSLKKKKKKVNCIAKAINLIKLKNNNSKLHFKVKH